MFDNAANVRALNYNGNTFYLLVMSRAGNHIKAKYFAFKDAYGNVPQKYASWEANKYIITYASGAYSTDWSTNGVPVGLTMENGNIINRNLEYGKLDGFIIVYATGGVVATNLKDADLTLDGLPRKYDLRGNSIDLNDFITWAQNKQATVFQTHLLAYRNQLTVYSNASSGTGVQTRRFLAVGKIGNDIVHVIVQCPFACTLYNGASSAFGMLENQLGMNVTWMINLDTGGKDISKCYKDKNNLTDWTEFRGPIALSEAINLIVYYYEN
jgi:hypothetical protein